MSQHGRAIKVRCFIHSSEGLYVAHCIDLGLACQAESMQEAREKLDAMIRDYLLRVSEIARDGDMKAAQQLLNRKSPTSILALYRYCQLRIAIHSGVESMFRTWRESLQSPFATQ